MPDEKLDSAESYLIGYWLRRFGCTNGNRGKDEAAFVQGYRDAAAGKPPAICPAASLESLDWQHFDPGSPDLIVDNQIRPSIDLAERHWGFHTIDKNVAVQPYVREEKNRLDQMIREERALMNKLEERLSIRNAFWFFAGLTLGILLAYLWSKLGR